MAQSVACMAGICGGVVEGALSAGISSSRALNGGASSSTGVVVRTTKPLVVALSQQQQGEVPDQSRRSLLGLLAASVAAGALVKQADAAVSDIKLYGPPAPFGGLPGTENADQARDTDLPLKERFYLQAVSPAEAVVRVKESVADIINVKSYIAKKAWPSVAGDLRNKASYLRFDLNTIISSKGKEEKKELKALTDKLWATIDSLDYAVRKKSSTNAEKYYAETVKSLNDVLAKIA